MSETTLDRLLTVRQAGELLGGERYVRRLIEERRIEYVKDDRRVFIRESVAVAYVAARVVQPIPRRRQLRQRRYRRAA
ncbi:excisionase [Streptomyces sp. NPDC001415]